jgi:hypothetical protein
LATYTGDNAQKRKRISSKARVFLPNLSRTGTVSYIFLKPRNRTHIFKEIILLHANNYVENKRGISVSFPWKCAKIKKKKKIKGPKEEDIRPEQRSEGDDKDEVVTLLT